MKLSCSPVCGDIFFDRTISNCIRSAIANWSKTLANELGEFDITVNNVLPGYTRTARYQSIVE